MDNVADFIAKVTNISATTAGMGGASAGILGSTSVGDPTVQQLKRTVTEFGAEYRKNPGSEATIATAKEVEGLLSALQTMSVITPEIGDQLIKELHNLLHA